MLLLFISSIISCIGLLMCLLLHFNQHFQFRACIKRKRSISYRSSIPILSTPKPPHHQATTTDIENVMISQELFKTQTICQSFITPVDDETFDFFPAAFPPYLIFLILFIFLIFYKLFKIEMNKYYYHYDDEYYTEMQCIKNIINIFFDYQYDIKYKNNKQIIDWIIMYFMIILSLWDSLFSFYRYYTTYYCAKKFYLLSTKTILKYFSVYAIPYLIIYLLQIHFYYFLYPLLILSHIIVNIWCNWMFAKILIDSTMQYASFVFIFFVLLLFCFF